MSAPLLNKLDACCSPNLTVNEWNEMKEAIPHTRFTLIKTLRIVGYLATLVLAVNFVALAALHSAFSLPLFFSWMIVGVSNEYLFVKPTKLIKRIENFVTTIKSLEAQDQELSELVSSTTRSNIEILTLKVTVKYMQNEYSNLHSLQKKLLGKLFDEKSQ